MTLHDAYQEAAAIARRTGEPALVLTPRYGRADYAAWPVASFHDPDRDDAADPAALAFFDVVNPSAGETPAERRTD